MSGLRLRFDDPALEAQFRAELAATMRVQFLVAWSIALAVVLGMYFVDPLVVPPQVLSDLRWWRYTLVTPPILAAVALAAGPPRLFERAWQWVGGLAAMAVIGIVPILGIVWLVRGHPTDMPVTMFGLVAITFWVFLAHVGLALRFAVASTAASLATAGYLAECIYVATIEAAPVVPFLVFWTVAANVLGMFTSYQLERLRRRDFALRREIERERASSEVLLKQELSHQVAARSRELGRMLAKVDATLVPGRPAIGSRFDTRYRIARELGAGAMGAVFEAERITDGQRLALKVVTGEVSADRAARFAREAEIGAKIRHPNVVEIVDVGVADGGVPYLAMELAPEGSLEAQRERFGDAAWARPILAGIARGLVSLHDARIVHRDLKPANVLLVGGDHPKISDFGISRFGELDTGDVDVGAATLAAAKPHALTATGMLLGTPYYMAPEAVRSPHVEPPSDVFAFGILAVEMMIGRPPFTTPPMFRALAGERLEAPLGLERVEPALRELLRRCLDEDPARRPSMRAVCEAFDATGR